MVEIHRRALSGEIEAEDAEWAGFGNVRTDVLLVASGDLEMHALRISATRNPL